MKNKRKENGSKTTKQKEQMNNTPNDNLAQSLMKEVFLGVFVVISMLLGLTLYFYYKVNSSYQDEIALMKDIHHLKASLVPFEKSNVKGFIEISEVFEGLNIIGKIEGLKPGSSHAVHVLEYSDLSGLEKAKASKEYLKHYNPTNRPHSCPSTNLNDDDKYHSGDFGNIIANNEGAGFISLTRKVSVKSLNGRLIVVTNSADKCQESQDYDSADDVLAYGLLNAVKPNIPSPVNLKNDYLMREINTVNKKEFDKKNKIVNEKKNLNGRNNNDAKKKDLAASLPPVIKAKVQTVLPLPNPIQNKNKEKEKEINVNKEKDVNFDQILKNIFVPSNNNVVKEENKHNKKNTHKITHKNKHKNKHDATFNMKDDNKNVKEDNFIFPQMNNVDKKEIHPYPHSHPQQPVMYLDPLPQLQPKDHDNKFLSKEENYNLPEANNNANKNVLKIEDNKLPPNFDYDFKAPFSEKFGDKLRTEPSSAPQPFLVLNSDSKNPFEHLNLNNPINENNMNNMNDNFNSFYSPLPGVSTVSALEPESDFKAPLKDAEAEKFNEKMQSLFNELDNDLLIETKSKATSNANSNTIINPPGSPKKEFEIPSLSLTQLSSSSSAKSKEAKDSKINKKLSKEKASWKTAQIHPHVEPSNSTFSFMSTNIEPYVNKLMNNTNSAKFLNKIDVSLLNPYADINLNPNPNNIAKSKRKKTHHNFKPSFDIDDILHRRQSKKNKEKENKHKEKDLNIMNNMDQIQNIIKNETLKELDELNGPLILIPGLTPKEPNVSKFNPKNKEKDKVFNFDFPILNDFKTDADLNTSSTTENKFNNNFDDFKKIFNFKQNNKSNSLFDKIDDVKESTDKIQFIKLDTHSTNNTQSTDQTSRSESLNKMLENYSNQDAYVKQLESNHDKNKLFLNKFKDNIKMIDELAQEQVNKNKE